MLLTTVVCRRTSCTTRWLLWILTPVCCPFSIDFSKYFLHRRYISRFRQLTKTTREKQQQYRLNEGSIENTNATDNRRLPSNVVYHPVASMDSNSCLLPF